MDPNLTLGHMGWGPNMVCFLWAQSLEGHLCLHPWMQVILKAFSHNLSYTQFALVCYFRNWGMVEVIHEYHSLLVCGSKHICILLFLRNYFYVFFICILNNAVLILLKI